LLFTPLNLFQSACQSFRLDLANVKKRKGRL